MAVRAALFFGVLVAAGAGVWAGVNYAGTEAAPWIQRGIGVLAIVAGAAIFLSPDPVDQRAAQLHGAGFAIFGAAQLLPSPWNLATLAVAVGLIGAAFVRRRRRAARQP